MKSKTALLCSITLASLVLSSALLFVQSSTVAAAGSESSTDWPMFRGDIERTGYSASSAPSTNQIKWIYNTTVEVDSSPAVANGRLIVGVSNGDVLAVNSTTGARLWAYETGASQNSIWSSPAIDSGKVYIGTRRIGTLFCLDESNGALLWSFQAGNDIDSSPIVKDGKVYFNSNDGKFYCLNANTGALIWSYKNSDVYVDNYSSAAIEGDAIFVGSGKSIFAFNAASGALKWNISTLGYVSSTPAISNEHVFVASSEGVSALNADTGAVIWNTSTVEGGLLNVFRSSPAIAYSKLFIGSIGGYIYALDTSSGSMVWKYKTLSEIWSSPAVADGKVYIGSGDGKIYCFDADTGTLLWSQMTVERIVSGPVIADGTVFVGCGGFGLGGRIYAFGAKYTKLSSLTLSLNSQTSFLGFKVNINGILTSADGAFEGASVLLSFSVNGGHTWNDITAVPTGVDGGYSAVWVPSATGSYLVKASWGGNYPYSSVEELRSLSVTLYDDQYVFSVESNSTVSALAFNSVTRELSFTVTGESNTRGFVNFAIAKSLLADTSGLKVYLDGVNIVYTISSTDDSWVLHFEFSHSTHSVSIKIGDAGSASSTPSSIPTPFTPDILVLAIIGLSAAVAVLAILLLVKSRKQRTV